ncbi:hypothetical protein BU16DRAFT_529073 [Lophium mytilinum]|uniref:Uncharacterized protein n=1 Tax=Lophium mytilinum TaxID=390894 RepID=A0A6A6QK18_9PEZI|nr:hypothetical protein BU16DRAFT_529073 [Lophium mytilinum]
MWRNARNVRITYKPLSPTTSATDFPPLDDLVTYNPLKGEKDKSVRGVDKVDASSGGWAYNWRGRGWLVIASSRWEVLGYGKEDAGDNDWVVTFFAKTLFTPAGLDLYSRSGEGLGEATVAGIRKSLEGVEDEVVRKLAEEIFVVKIGEAEK